VAPVFPFDRLQNPSYSVLDLSAFYDLNPHLALQARIGNLLDEEYQESIGFPAYGRNGSLGIMARF
jgi:outer membrane receptor protein involved in Fe transport